MLERSSLPKSNGKSRPYRPRGRRPLDGCCAAAIRAVTGAQLLLDHKVSSVAAAAIACGSCRQYVAAAITLLQSGNAALTDDVLYGRQPLLAAARRYRQLAILIEAYRNASPTDRVAFARTIGPANLWDQSLAPVLD
jgi:hypothetical protein